jgi:hypothetical protein
MIQINALVVRRFCTGRILSRCFYIVSGDIQNKVLMNTSFGFLYLLTKNQHFKDMRMTDRIRFHLDLIDI